MKISEALRNIVCVENRRRYYRFRGGRWYGGIATADCVGCNLRCVFCWGWQVRDKPSSIGRFYTPQEVSGSLLRIAERKGYTLVRISGNEPTLSWRHLLEVIGLIEAANLSFILETNGILIGSDKSYARDLSKFSNLHVRVSIKGTSPEEFHLLTGAVPEAFHFQLKALENLLDYNVTAHPAVMVSFSEPGNVERLKSMLADIDKALVAEFEEEYVFLYPHVVKQLTKAGIRPRKAYSPDNIPEELV